MSPRSALVLCAQNNPGLLGSYGRALKKAQISLRYFDLGAAIQRHVKFDRVGRLVTTFVPFEPWVLGGNRDLLIEVLDHSPDCLLFAGAVPIRAGVLAQIKMSRPSTRVVLLWPDTLLNLGDNLIACLPVCDLVISYSSSAVPQLQRLGARRVEFLPFAIDTELFPADVTITDAERVKYGSDFCFIGNHRPDRERAVLALLANGMSVKVWGADWKKRAAERGRLPAYLQEGPIFGREFVKAAKCAKVNLNTIDPTNFPAANMRFFETFACGGAALCSPCPEMAEQFPNRECVLYFDEATLVPAAREMVQDPHLCATLAREGRRRALEGHTYDHRAASLLALLD